MRKDFHYYPHLLPTIIFYYAKVLTDRSEKLFTFRSFALLNLFTKVFYFLPSLPISPHNYLIKHFDRYSFRVELSSAI